MGQAFDRDGNVLGEAYGETKREVFDKLTSEFKDAAEIRIKSIERRLSVPSIEMPRYVCHKEVHALKIKEVRQAPPDQERQHPGGDWLLIPEDERYAPIVVGHDDYYRKHSPVAGGYYVVYAGGYQSFSPPGPFETGYTKVG